MKRIFLSIMLVVAAAVSVSAQGRWGVRVSYELACPTDVEYTQGIKADMFGNRSGFSLGAVYNMPVFYGLYFEPGVTLAYNTFSVNSGWINSNISQNPDFAGLTLTSATMNMWDLRIPIIGGYKFDIFPGLALSVFTGPELSLGMSAKVKYKFGSLSMDESAYGGDGFMNRTDVKWRFGVGAELADHFYGSISGAVGLCDRIESNEKMMSNLFDLTIGYNF